MDQTPNEPEMPQVAFISQAEADRLMELWKQGQHEKAARQSMLTAYDVAEAIQLPAAEVQRRLEEDRAEQKVKSAMADRLEHVQSHLRLEPNARNFVDAYWILAPFLSTASFLLAFFFQDQHVGRQIYQSGLPSPADLILLLFSYSFINGGLVLYRIDYQRYRRRLQGGEIRNFRGSQQRDSYVRACTRKTKLIW